MSRRLIVAVLLTSISVRGALAAGYAVREQSADAIGSAYAGAAATSTDASYLAYNPAAAATVDGGDVSLSAASIQPSSSATYSTALTAAGTPIAGSKLPSGFISNAIIPDIAIRQRLDDHWSAGISLSVPWGLSTNYPTADAGLYYGLETKLQTVNISPVIAYDIVPGITLAGGFQAQYAKGRLTSAVDIGTLGALAGIPGSIPGGMDGLAEVDSHSWAYGYVLGGQAAISDGWTLGLSYRSAVHHTLKGPWTFTLDNDGVGAAIRGATGLLSNTTASAKLVTPDVIELGMRKEIAQGWTALLEVDRTGWSNFHELNVVAANPAQPADVTNANWHDSWMTAVGTEYILDNDWAFRGGLAYDGSPIPDSTLETRIPDADRYWISGGATYHVSQKTDLKLSLSHLFIQSREIQQSASQLGNALRGTLDGKTRSSVDVLGLQFDYHWH